MAFHSDQPPQHALEPVDNESFPLLLEVSSRRRFHVSFNQLHQRKTHPLLLPKSTQDERPFPKPLSDYQRNLPSPLPQARIERSAVPSQPLKQSKIHDQIPCFWYAEHQPRNRKLFKDLQLRLKPALVPSSDNSRHDSGKAWPWNPRQLCKEVQGGEK